MLSRLAKLLLTSTAIAPVLFTYAYVACASGAVKQGILLSLLGVLLFVLCIFLLRYCSKHLEKVDFSMTTAEVGRSGEYRVFCCCTCCPYSPWLHFLH